MFKCDCTRGHGNERNANRKLESVNGLGSREAEGRETVTGGLEDERLKVQQGDEAEQIQEAQRDSGKTGTSRLQAMVQHRADGGVH